MTKRTKTLLHAVLLAGAGWGLSGCVYDLGLGFASDGYYDDDYGCDPYGGYAAYYDCDYGQGFGNIGFGGGWYDNYYYPGYGIFLFDNFGRRYPMREQYRRYWGERRHTWYREHRGDRPEHGRYEGRRGDTYSDGMTPGANEWPDRKGPRGDRAQGADNNRSGDRRDGRGQRDDYWRGRDGRGIGAAPVPNANILPRSTSGKDNFDGIGQRDRRSDVAPAAPPARQPPIQQDADGQPRSPQPTRAAPKAPPERPNPTSRQDRDEGEVIRDQ